MPDTQPQSKQATPRTLLDIPAELRLRIYDYIYDDIVIAVERGPCRPRGEDTESADQAEKEQPENGEQEDAQDEGGGDDEAETANHGIEITYAPTRNTYGISELPKVPREILALRLVCRTTADEIVEADWHSKILYKFPSTVAFVDILSQWPESKVCGLRQAHVLDTPLPLFKFDNDSYYTTHQFSDALPMFPGLQLDLLIVENIWLEPNGCELDGWCFGAVRAALAGLARSNGWKELHYATGILGLTPRHMREIDAIVQQRRDDDEPDLTLTWGRNRPQLSGIVTHLTDGTTRSDDPDEDVRDVKAWYEEHPEERGVDHWPDVSEKDIHFKLQRGRKAKYVQDGAGRTAVIKSLMDNISWVDLRKTDDYLVDDGLESPTRHL